MATFNRVTERPHIAAGATLWLVSAEWRGGHDRRIIRLSNIYESEREARAAWSVLTKERHNTMHHKPADYDSGFVRLPLRSFRECADA